MKQTYTVGVSISETPGPDVFTTELNEADYPGLKKDQPPGETSRRSGTVLYLLKVEKHCIVTLHV
jgi:hypothetical protein